MDLRGIERIVKEALSVSRKVLVEPDAKEVLKLASFQVPASRVVKDVSGAIEAAREIGFPVALKLISPDIIHKSDAGGVFLNVMDEKEIEEKWSGMILGMADDYPTAIIEGFLVEEMVGSGAEVIVGCLRDPQFGPVVMFGIGGVTVELMKDVSFRLAPITREEAFEMMAEVKGFPILTGFRGKTIKDLDAIADALIKLGEIMARVDGIKELEINPLIVHERGAVVADARAILE
ncbi:MAG: acetate--CoA ligase family protein [Deltaproteobacteria bacterium]|nr:acetate--CoA ligase family protein [Deltaproteobacteria bacterium]